jgi:hypothetical protein
MVNANLKEKVRKAGHISDSSFNSALIRLPLSAVADIVTDLVPEDRRNDVMAALVAAGAPDVLSFKSVIKYSLKTLGKKVLGEAADNLVDEPGAFLDPILRDSVQIAAKWSPIFNAGADNDV